MCYESHMSEIELLERRVTALEQEVEGEKVVSRYILEQVRKNADDLAALRGRAGRIEGRLDSIESRLSRIEQRMDRIESEFRNFRAELPRMMAETMREVLAERDAKR